MTFAPFAIIKRPVTSNIILSCDAMGGDNGPNAVIPGIDLALQDGLKASFLLFGKPEILEPILSQYPKVAACAQICAAETIITPDEKPSQALRKGATSSMRMAIDAVKDGRAQAVISSGNTGALMATAKMVLKSLPGVDRPSIASLMPNIKGRSVVLDLGANLTTDADGLVQMAVLGAIFAQINLKVERPTVGLLNVGSEEQKGHEYIREAASILSDLKFPGRYYGFVEGDDIGKGTVDVIVTDGFTGNVALKTAEGIGKMAGAYIREAFTSSVWSKIGYLLANRAMKRIRSKIDGRQYNGGLFLGLNGLCIKSHGGADAFAFSRAVIVAADMVREDYISRVAKALENVPHHSEQSAAAEAEKVA